MRFALFAFILFVLAACGPAADTEQQARVPVAEHTAETADGITLHYRIAGEGEETVIAPFALFHGKALDSLARGRRVVTYDPRGRGRSEAAPLERVSLDYLLSDFETVRAAVGAEQVAVIGWSGGGMETFVYALRNPGRVTRLVQLTPVSARFDPYGMEFVQDRQSRVDQDEKTALDARVAAGEFENDEAAYCKEDRRVAGAASFADPVNNRPETPDVCIYENEYPSRLRGYFGALFQSIAGYDWRDELNDVTIPRLVVHGAQDNTSFKANSEWVAGQVTARILVIENAGHWPHYEQPEETLSAIETFLSGEWPEGAQALPEDDEAEAH